MSAARSDPQRAVAIVPARLGSQRLPRKMLLDRSGQCLFVHTALNLRASGACARVVVATDSEEILEAARRGGIECRLTRADHVSGTDRVNEAWQALRAAGEEAHVVLNVQGDEPELLGSDLVRLVEAFQDREVQMASLCGPLGSAAEADEPSVVKVVRDARGDALYFSRARIPARGHARGRAQDEGDLAMLRRHIGVYAFTPVALERFCSLPAGRLELHESLEQLRWLEAGLKLRVLDAERVPQGVDTLQDYERFVARCTGPGA